MSKVNRIDHFVKTGDTGLPIFFLQLGSRTSLFFDKVLKQAALTNGTENVFVLTDVNFDQYRAYNCIDISRYAFGSLEFDGLYKHHSTNSYFFEKTCFDRWFMINAMIRELKIDHFFYADCDVLIMEKLQPVHAQMISGGYEGSTMYFEGGEGKSVTSAHTSFWSSKLLDDFCRFICAKYKDKAAFNKLLRDTLAGKYLDNTNMSDMILLDAFRTETKPRVFNLFTLEESGICFDFNANVAYNGHQHTFVMNPAHRIKKFTKVGGGLVGRVTASAADVMYCKFYTVHFQGYITKSLIPVYVTALTKKEAIKNQIVGEYNFAVRKMKLLKNKVKRTAVAMTGRARSM